MNIRILLFAISTPLLLAVPAMQAQQILAAKALPISVGTDRTQERNQL
jgi:hypothetical protein